MTKKDILEIKKRFKKEACTFTRLCGCYVDGEKNKIVNIAETFLNLDDEECHKYLDIAKKTLSGTPHNNLLELEFPLEEESIGGKQQFLMGLKDSKLKNEALLDRFYDLIIENYNYVGNYLILIFHDAYDVITKTTDHLQLDESEEVYEYLLCAICPVSLSKPGLGYREEEHRIGARIRDWVVGSPENGFIFPAFTDRSSDIHATMFYTKNPKDTHPEFMECGLGCTSKKSATEQKEEFHTIVKHALGEDTRENHHIFMEIQENLNELVLEQEALDPSAEEPVIVTKQSIQTILTESGVPEEAITKIEQSYEDTFGNTPLVAEHLVDAKALESNVQEKAKQELVKEVLALRQKITETDSIDSNSCDVILTVNPLKVTQIKTQIMDGQKCLIIPMDDEEQATVNGNIYL